MICAARLMIVGFCILLIILSVKIFFCKIKQLIKGSCGGCANCNNCKTKE